MFQVPRAPQVQSGTFALAPLSSFDKRAERSSLGPGIRQTLGTPPPRSALSPGGAVRSAAPEGWALPTVRPSGEAQAAALTSLALVPH
eukprot:3875174-Alexandrium_andersonii.AAC.1